MKFVLVPLLRWTGRRDRIFTSFGNNNQRYDTKKLVLVGKISIHGLHSHCLMVFNLVTQEIEQLKILSFLDNQSVNCIAYGPFDNGHILLGLSDGWLLAYAYPSLERVECKQIFWSQRVPNDIFKNDIFKFDFE